jgi:uncharacterized protein DUF6504
MSRVYGEPVKVHARPDGRPVRFVWRSRLYTVRAILEHWVINGEWWRDPGGDQEARPGQPELEFWRVEALLAPSLPGGPIPPDPPWGRTTPPSPPGARRGQGMTPGVYELRQDLATGAWTLRV